MKIAVASDHRGVKAVEQVKAIIAQLNHECLDFSPPGESPVDYPDVARKVGEAVAGGLYDFGILICGTGIGMSIAANKVKGIRAALCHDAFDAQRARQHNNANILCLGAERERGPVPEVVKAFFTENFEGGRHQRRLDKIRDIEG